MIKGSDHKYPRYLWSGYTYKDLRPKKKSGDEVIPMERKVRHSGQYMPTYRVRRTSKKAV